MSASPAAAVRRPRAPAAVGLAPTSATGPRPWKCTKARGHFGRHLSASPSSTRRWHLPSRRTRSAANDGTRPRSARSETSAPGMGAVARRGGGDPARGSDSRMGCGCSLGRRSAKREAGLTTDHGSASRRSDDPFDGELGSALVETVDPNRFAERHAEDGNPGAALREDLDVLTLFTASLCQDSERVTEVAAASGADAEALQAVIALLPVPFLHACNRRWASSISESWVEGYCPVCGSWPAFAEVRGIERSRSFPVWPMWRRVARSRFVLPVLRRG